MSFSLSSNSKTEYKSQTPTINYIIYKTHKSTMFDLDIKIVIAVVTQCKKCKPPSLIVANSYGLGLDETTILELGRCCRKVEGK